MATHRKQRGPQLRFQALRGIGWHMSYRDPATGTPMRHRFGITDKRREREARVLYHAWVLEHLGGANPNGYPKKIAAAKKADAPDARAGSLLDIANGLIEAERARTLQSGLWAGHPANGLIEAERARTRDGDEPRRRGTIAPAVFLDRRKQISDFLDFMNPHRALMFAKPEVCRKAAHLADENAALTEPFFHQHGFLRRDERRA